MFTGIVAELGKVTSLERTADDARIAVRAPSVTSATHLGHSIAVNGVCLTVAAIDGDVFTADVMPETLQRSTLGALATGALVNLELALTPASPLGGHVVQGHVDGVATLLAREPGPRWDTVRFSLPAALARYVAEKGSVAVDGVSLTVIEAGADFFTVGLIPTTLAATTLGQRSPGDDVNLEVDVLAKYVERLLTMRETALESES